MKQFNIYLLALIAILILCISCEKAPKNTTGAIIPLSFSEQEVIESSNNFSINIFKEISIDTNENVFISPLSIGMALAMTYNGAEGVTKTEMENVLGFENADSNSINNAYKNIYNNLLLYDEKVELSLANSIWYKQELTVEETYKNIIENCYYGGINPINTSDPASKDIINSWVEEKTNDKIKDLVKYVSPDDVMFLVNAIYFNGKWKYQFNKDDTYDGTFYKEDGSTVSCKIMALGESEINTNSTDDFMLVEMPYGDGLYNMVVLLPSTNKTVNDIIETLNTKLLDSLINTSTTRSIQIKMPKFKVEYEQKLNNVLKSIGMPTAFDDQNAEFPHLFKEIKEIKGYLYISRVRHKAFVEVNEEGSEAAAATVVAITYDSIDIPETVMLNRPFIYFIRENTTGTILFAGKLIEPVI